MKLCLLSRTGGQTDAKKLRGVLAGKVLLQNCNSLHVLHDGLNSNKSHFVKCSDCLIPRLAVAVTLSLLNQQDLYAWMGELQHWNWGLDGQPEIHPFRGSLGF